IIDKFHDILNKCIGWQSFPKKFPIDYCKICNFWNYLGFIQRIPETQVQIANNKPLFSNKILDLDYILKQIFEFFNFCEGQYDAIYSFLENKDTLVVLQTGGDKTLCFAMAALASFCLTVIFTLLKALIDNHVNSLISIGISAAGLYAFIDQFYEYQKRVFSEYLLGILPILFVTPEKLEKNKSFYQLLQKFMMNRESNLLLMSLIACLIIVILGGLTIGRYIIYCSSPDSCQELFNN
ncbi:14137_t:CDS:2, partial [Funneliformis geosporum]